MKKVKITAIRKTQYDDLVALYENPIEHACDVREGQVWISIDGQRPEGLCSEAWKTMREFVEALARGEGNFFDGWMKNPHSAMISCNDGFRPVSFYLETITERKKFYKNRATDTIFWIKSDMLGEHLFTFDKKTIFNLFADYPWKLSVEEKVIFDKENPFWADFFKDRQC